MTARAQPFTLRASILGTPFPHNAMDEPIRDESSSNVPTDVAAELSRLAGSPPRGGTAVRLLRDGTEAFPAMIEAIGNAQRSVRFENFIFAGDATGRSFAEALSTAARRGVDVRVL